MIQCSGIDGKAVLIPVRRIFASYASRYNGRARSCSNTRRIDRAANFEETNAFHRPFSSSLSRLKSSRWPSFQGNGSNLSLSVLYYPLYIRVKKGEIFEAFPFDHNNKMFLNASRARLIRTTFPFDSMRFVLVFSRMFRFRHKRNMFFVPIRYKNLILSFQKWFGRIAFILNEV